MKLCIKEFYKEEKIEINQSIPDSCFLYQYKDMKCFYFEGICLNRQGKYAKWGRNVENIYYFPKKYKKHTMRIIKECKSHNFCGY